MPARKIILLIVALLVAGTTVIMARSLLSEKKPAEKTAAVVQKTYEILVVAKDLPAGALLKEGDLKWQPWVESGSGGGDGGYISKDKGKMSDFVGTVARQDLHAGEPVVEGRVVKPGDRGFMAAILSPGMRAMAIPVTPTSGVAGFIHPGDHVDVIVTHKIENREHATHPGMERETKSRVVSETVLHNVRILAVDQRTSSQETETPKISTKAPEYATIEVSAKQAETVALARELGTLTLTLLSLANDPEPAAPSAPTTGVVFEDNAPQEDASSANGLAVDAAALALPKTAVAAPGLTWDSEVSHVLPRPANPLAPVQKITIIRGKESSEAVYELPSP